MPKKVLIALPPAMLEQADQIAQAECRTRSDLIREAIRQYIDGFKRRQHALAHGPHPAAEPACGGGIY